MDVGSDKVAGGTGGSLWRAIRTPWVTPNSRFNLKFPLVNRVAAGMLCALL